MVWQHLINYIYIWRCRCSYSHNFLLKIVLFKGKCATYIFHMSISVERANHSLVHPWERECGTCSSMGTGVHHCSRCGCWNEQWTAGEACLLIWFKQQLYTRNDILKVTQDWTHFSRMLLAWIFGVDPWIQLSCERNASSLAILIPFQVDAPPCLQVAFA